MQIYRSPRLISHNITMSRHLPQQHNFAADEPRPDIFTMNNNTLPMMVATPKMRLLPTLLAQVITGAAVWSG